MMEGDVERMLAAGKSRAHLQHVRATRPRDAQAVIRTVCQQAGVSAEELRMGGRRRRLSAVRAHLAIYLVRQLGLSLADAARLRGVSTSGIAKAVAPAEGK